MNIVTQPAPILAKKAAKMRGLFLNTASEQCSIHESGGMVYNNIINDDNIAIDYVEIKRIDYTGLDGKDFLRKVADDFSHPLDAADYDFTIVNYHHYTMAPHLGKRQLDGLPGPKYAIVLEVEPHDCLAFCPYGWFDGYIVLDPSVRDARPEVFPFPRPIEDIRDGNLKRVDPIPLIGSFGFGTPGKGFELLVDAVNREFDRAVIRINIPSNVYADEAMHTVHAENYARYLARTCKGIAKPGVEVEVSFDFMAKEKLVEWCAENTLNCFMYVRKQSGLAATTDQSIASGRPLLVSGNQTFRHIHQYIRPYPGTSLREAIEQTGPIVKKIQADWSPQSFRETFMRMLKATQRAGDRRPAPVSSALASSTARDAKPVMLVIPPAPITTNSLETIVDRAVTAISDTSLFRVVKCTPKSEDGYARVNFWIRPDVVLLPGWESDAAREEIKKLRQTLPGCPAIIGSVTDGHDPGRPPPSSSAEEGIALRPLQGVVPFFTHLISKPAGRSLIGLFGYEEGAQADELASVMARIEREIGYAHVIIHVSPATTLPSRAALDESLRFVRRQLASATVEQKVTPSAAGERMALLARNSVNIIRYVESRASELTNLRDLALTTERPLVLTRRAPFPETPAAGPWLEDKRLESFVAAGIGGNIGIYNDLSEGRFVSEIENLALGLVKTSGGRRALRADNLVDGQGWVLMSGNPAFLVDQGSALPPLERPDPQEPVPMPPEQRLLLAAASSLAASHDQPRISVIGDPDLPCPAGLRREGLLVTEEGEEADIALASNVAVGPTELEDRLNALARVLKPGGFGLVMTYHAEPYQTAFLASEADFRVVTPDAFERVASRTEQLRCVLQPTVSSRAPCLTPEPFTAPPVGLYLLQKRI